MQSLGAITAILLRVRIHSLTLLTVIAFEPQWAIARDGGGGGTVVRISRRSQNPVLGGPALAAILAAARTNAVHMNLHHVNAIIDK